MRVCKLRRLQAHTTAGEARCAARAADSLVARFGLTESELADGAALDAAPSQWESERLLTERPPREMLWAALRSGGRTAKNAAGTAAGEELGLRFGSESALRRSLLAAYVAEQRPVTTLDLASREAASRTVADVFGTAADGAAALAQLPLGRPPCGHSNSAALMAAAIADMYTVVRAPDVLCCPPEAAVSLSAEALLGAGDLVVCQFPTTPQLYSVLHNLGCRVLFWKPDKHGQYTQAALDYLLASSSPAIDPTALLLRCVHRAHAAQSVRRALLTASRTHGRHARCHAHSLHSIPSEPLGWMPSRDMFTLMLDACRRRGTYVIADETHAALADEAMRLPTVADSYELGVSVCSLGGAFGLAALRCGWVASTNRALLNRIDELNSFNADTSLCSPADTLALAALQPRTWRALLERSREMVTANRARLLRFLSAHADVFECTPPLAGLTAVVRLRGERALLAPEFCRRLVQTFGVLLLPDAVYQAGHAGKGAATGTTAGGFCIAFGAAHFGAALDVLEGALSRLGPTLGVVDAVRAEDAPQAPV